MRDTTELTVACDVRVSAKMPVAVLEVVTPPELRLEVLMEAESTGSTVTEICKRYGLPRRVLSDNGLIFTGRLHGLEVAFAVSLKALGVELLNSAPWHPPNPRQGSTATRAHVCRHGRVLVGSIAMVTRRPHNAKCPC